MPTKRPAIQYLIFTGHHVAIIDVPPELSSDGYGKLQDWFGQTTRGEAYSSSMRRISSHTLIHGVWYHEELAGPDGASFELFHLPDIPDESVQAAKDHIFRSFDVVRLRVIHFKTVHDIQDDVDRIAKEDRLANATE